MTTLQEQVAEFHRTFDHPIASSPTIPADERVRLRMRIITEEFFEMMEAVYGRIDKPYWESLVAEVDDLIDQSTPDVDLSKLADALGDIDYVVEGCRLEFGIDGKPIADAIHAANMAKVGGGKRADGKHQKPEGWQPPDIEGELIKQGWRP